MRTFIFLAGLILASPVFAAELSKDSVLGTTTTEVQTNLTNMGYEVRKVEIDDGEIEAYFIDGKKLYEVYVSKETGKITKLKTK